MVKFAWISRHPHGGMWVHVSGADPAWDWDSPGKRLSAELSHFRRADAKGLQWLYLYNVGALRIANLVYNRNNYGVLYSITIVKIGLVNQL